MNYRSALMNMLRMHPKTINLFCALRPKIVKMYVISVHVYNTLHELYCRFIFVPLPVAFFPGFIPALTLYFHECEQHKTYSTTVISSYFVSSCHVNRKRRLARNILHTLKYT
jgi:hypothetical protein